MAGSEQHTHRAHPATLRSGSAGAPETRPAKPTIAPQEASWRKSSHSAYNGGCVEAAPLGDHVVGVRDTKDQGAGPVLMFTGVEWAAFLSGLRAGKLG